VNTLHLGAFIPFLILVAGSLPGIGMAEMPSPASSKIQPANFEGWKEQQISNPWVTLTIVPQLGGRVIEVTVANHPYLFLNVQLKGKYFPHSEAEYPGNSTVIFYTNGPALEFDVKDMPFRTSATLSEMPYYMEAEVNSPMIVLKPGETYSFDTSWLPTRIRGRAESVTQARVTDSGRTLSRKRDSVLLSGPFGVFFPGRLTAYLFDIRASELPWWGCQP
jgi:hypothetical protein